MAAKNIFYLIKNNNSVFMSHNLSFDIFNTIVDNYKMLRMDYNGKIKQLLKLR